MSHLLPSEKLEEQLPKLLPGVLGLYKKHAETVHVSRVRSGVQLQGARGRGEALGAASLSGGRGQEPGSQAHLALPRAPFPALPHERALGWRAGRLPQPAGVGLGQEEALTAPLLPPRAEPGPDPRGGRKRGQPHAGRPA